MQAARTRLAVALCALLPLLAGCSSKGASPPVQRTVATTVKAKPATMKPILARALPAIVPVVGKPTPSHKPMLTQVQMVGPYGGWAIEQLFHGMAIARTQDGGRHWHTVYVSQYVAVALSAVDMQSAYVLLRDCSGASCSATELVATHDGGGTWAPLYSTQEFSAKAISFPTSSVGYVAGLGSASQGEVQGELLKTEDAGQVWTGSPLPCAATFLALSFESSDVGWLLCGGASGSGMQAKELYRTTDGGGSWSLVASVSLAQPGTSETSPANELPLTGFVHSIFFRSATQGWIGLDRGGIYETLDGGAHWRAVWQPPFAPHADDAFSVGFSDAMHGWLLYGEGPPLSTTSDGGRTWTIVYPPLSPATSLSFSSPEDGIAAGWVYDGTLILSTHDGGRTWAMAGRAPVDISSLTAFDARDFLVLGQDAVYRSADGGVTWAAFPLPKGYYAAAVGMEDETDGYLVAYRPKSGRVLFSTADGGASWQPVPTPFTPSSVAVTAQGAVLAVGSASQSQVFVHTFSGKVRAVSLRPGVPYLWRLRGGRWWPVRIPGWSSGQSPPTGLRSGPDGLLWMWSQSTLWLSTDDGASWQSIPFGSRLSISDACFVSPQQGWILTSGNAVYMTDDGGESWNELSSSPAY